MTFNNYFGFWHFNVTMTCYTPWDWMCIGISGYSFFVTFREPSSSPVHNGRLFRQRQRLEVYRHGAPSRNEGNNIWTRNAHVPFLANCLYAAQIDAIHEKVRVTRGWWEDVARDPIVTRDLPSTWTFSCPRLCMSDRFVRVRLNKVWIKMREAWSSQVSNYYVTIPYFGRIRWPAATRKG